MSSTPPFSFSVLFAQVIRSGKIAPEERYKLMNAILEETLEEEERVLGARLLGSYSDR